MSFTLIWVAANIALSYAIAQRAQSGTEMVMIFSLIWLTQLAAFFLTGRLYQRLMSRRTREHADLLNRLVAEGQVRQDRLVELHKETLELQSHLRTVIARHTFQD
jgi:Tfp pilus assembly protein PilN